MGKTDNERSHAITHFVDTTAQQRRSAARYIRRRGRDAEDVWYLLEILGLSEGAD